MRFLNRSCAGQLRKISGSSVQALTRSIACQRPNYFSAFVETLMKRRTGPPPIYLASSGTEKMPAPHSEERLLSLLATLEECRALLVDKASPETGRLLSL